MSPAQEEFRKGFTMVAAPTLGTWRHRVEVADILFLDDSKLRLTLRELSSDRIFHLDIPYRSMITALGGSYTENPGQYGSGLAVLLEEEIDTGLLD